jgi:transcriptional regulator with XRE-family HTH domain
MFCFNCQDVLFCFNFFIDFLANCINIREGRQRRKTHKGEKKMTRFALLRQKILKLSQREIAKQIGITQQSWAELEKQTKEMKKKSTLQLLKFHFGVNPDWLQGKSHLLFCDYQKGLEVVKEKVFQKRLSSWELLFLLEVMHYVYSDYLASKTSKETRREFVINLVDSIKYFLTRYEVNEAKIEAIALTSAILSSLGQDLFEALEAVQKLSPKIQLARELISVLISFFKDFELSEEDERVLSQFLLPWSYYVALSFNAIKQKLIPLSSVYFSSSLDELFNFERESAFEKFEFFFEKNKVYFEFSGDKFDFLFKDKLQMTLDISEAFAFFVLLTKSKEVDFFTVLSFSIHRDKLAKSIKLSFTQKTTAISAMFSYDEFDDLVELVEKVKENAKLWLYLQKAHLEVYGFV